MNNNFQELNSEESLEIMDEQVCMIVMNNDQVFAGYYRSEFKPAMEMDIGSPPEKLFENINLNNCHKSADNGKTWVKAGGNFTLQSPGESLGDGILVGGTSGMSFCELNRDYVKAIYTPKKESKIEECMRLWDEI